MIWKRIFGKNEEDEPSQNPMEVLRQICDSPPSDLIAHFECDHLPSDPELSINILPLGKAVEDSLAIQSISDYAPLGPVVLDDANNSNPFCYITKGPARGAVLYLSHDGIRKFAYASLDDFMKAIGQACRRRIGIEDMPHDLVLDSLDRSAIVKEITRLLKPDEDMDQNAVVEQLCIYARTLTADQNNTFESLVRHDDMFVREAVAERVEELADTSLRAIAKCLCQDEISQVARAAQRALAVIDRSG